jgi:hypothetical protein
MTAFSGAATGSADTNFAENPQRGIASLQFNGKTLRFRTNPNEIWWSYTLNTNVEQTYGGRVVQILSTRIDDLVIKIDCGRGGLAYMNQVVDFLRQMMIDQRKDGGKTAIFSYTTRRWRMKVYALSVPFQDSVTATLRELEIRFKVQEDLTGEMSKLALDTELARLQDGIGFKYNQFNKPGYGLAPGETNLQRESPAGVSPTDAVPQGVGAALDVINSLGIAIPGLPTP